MGEYDFDTSEEATTFLSQGIKQLDLPATDATIDGENVDLENLPDAEPVSAEAFMLLGSMNSNL